MVGNEARHNSGTDISSQEAPNLSETKVTEKTMTDSPYQLGHTQGNRLGASAADDLVKGEPIPACLGKLEARDEWLQGYTDGFTAGFEELAGFRPKHMPVFMIDLNSHVIRFIGLRAESVIWLAEALNWGLEEVEGALIYQPSLSDNGRGSRS